MNFKVLIVDDAGFIRQILGELLIELGCEIVGEARTGQEAVERAALLKPHAIFMDMVLPGKNGAEATEDILEILPDTQVIAMSTATEEIIRSKASTAGCVHFLEKPFNRESLKSLLLKIDSYSSSGVLKRAEGE